MYDEVSHWQWLAWGMGCLLFMFFIYYMMIKSAEYVTRLYQGNQTLPSNNYHELFGTKSEETKSNPGEEGDGKQNRAECEESTKNP